MYLFYSVPNISGHFKIGYIIISFAQKSPISSHLILQIKPKSFQWRTGHAWSAAGFLSGPFCYDCTSFQPYWPPGYSSNMPHTQTPEPLTFLCLQNSSLHSYLIKFLTFFWSQPNATLSEKTSLKTLFQITPLAQFWFLVPWFFSIVYQRIPPHIVRWVFIACLSPIRM